jgi:lipopolysaccharide export system permease protein
MYILTRYVVWEVLTLFLASLVALTLVVTPVMAVSVGLKEGFPITVILRIMPYMLPEMLGITLPAAMLFSVCSVFGRMTGANEVVALKSLGISPMAVIWPALVLAAFLSLGTVWMYEIAATWCKPNVLRIGIESFEEIAYSMLKKIGSCDRDAFPVSITVKRVDGRKLIEPTITFKGPQTVTYSAAVAELHTDLPNHVLWIDCWQSEIDIRGQGMGSIWGALPGMERHSVPINVPFPPRYHRDWVAMRDIPELIAELQARIDERQTTLRQLDRLLTASRALGLPESPGDAEKLATQIDRDRSDLLRLKAERYRRWANGFTCLCFALVGIPVAMLWRHADVLTNFFVCFLPILALYYPLLMLSDDLSTSGKLWPISFWTADVVLVIPAVALLRRIVRR